MVREDDLYRGMTVVGPDDRPIGKVDHIVKDKESREMRFLGVDGRLLPVDAVQEVEKGRVKVSVPKDRLGHFPLHKEEHLPPYAQQDKALDALGMHGNAGVPPRDTNLEPGQEEFEKKTPSE